MPGAVLDDRVALAELSQAAIVEFEPGTSGGEEVGHAPGRARSAARPLLEVKGVAARYGAFRALHDVSFTVAEGEVLALLGAPSAMRGDERLLSLYVGEAKGNGARPPGSRPAA
jgi:ATPase subunit of ABC transporter with duplicated ATPase domains